MRWKCTTTAKQGWRRANPPRHSRSGCEQGKQQQIVLACNMDASATMKEVMHNVGGFFLFFLLKVREFLVYDVLCKTTFKQHQMIN